MFDQPPSLAMRAALASLLGGLFGVGLILFSNSAQAQATETIDASPAASAPAATTDAVAIAVLRRLGDATLRGLRSTEPAIRGLRIHDNASEISSGLRWQPAPRRVLRSDVENPRGNDQLSLGLQLSF